MTLATAEATVATAERRYGGMRKDPAATRRVLSRSALGANTCTDAH
jgi:hypothetical protein